MSKNKKQSYLHNQIDQWISSVWADGSYKNSNDLHIDEIDPAFSFKANWLYGGITCLNIAIKIRDAKKMPLITMLAMSLKSKRVPIGIKFKSPLELQKEFDDSPPSLYLLEKNPYKTKEKVDFVFFPDYLKSYYVETIDKNIDPDYSRSIIILSEPSGKKDKSIHARGLTRHLIP